MATSTSTEITSRLAVLTGKLVDEHHSYTLHVLNSYRMQFSVCKAIKYPGDTFATGIIICPPPLQSNLKVRVFN